MAGPAVRQAGGDDVTAAARTLARAFQDDPAFRWASPRDRRRERIGPAYFRAVLRGYVPKGEVQVTDDVLAVAVWAPPERWRASAWQGLALLPTMLAACGTKLPRAARMVSMMERRHEEREEPHYYLPFVGTDPDARGQGRGTALLGHMLERCDAEGVPAYLEATSAQNQALYHRHGFVALEELRWPGGGPPFWPMWRAPR